MEMENERKENTREKTINLDCISHKYVSLLIK